MIGIDTNVLLRVLTGDTREQADSVAAFLNERSARDPAYVSAITLVETLWVLRTRMKLARPVVAGALRALLSNQEFVVEFGEKLSARLETADPSISDIADCLIAWSGERAGCSKTMTFDRKAARAIPSMELLA